MKPSILIVCTFLGVLPLEALSKPLILSPNELVQGGHALIEQKQDKPSKRQVEPQNEKADIKMVPKSRRQVKPEVVKPKLKIKPIKIIRPKIKRP